MTPVEATRTLSAGIPRYLAVSWHIIRASEMPRCEVQTFAMPEFTITARITPLRRCSFVTSKGAPLTVFFVYTATAVHGFSEYKRARSGFDFFIPQQSPDASTPGTAVIPSAFIGDCKERVLLKPIDLILTAFHNMSHIGL